MILDRIGVFSLFELLKWDGVLDVNSGWGPWVGDGLSVDGRSTQSCMLILFNGHPVSSPDAPNQTTLHAFSLRRLTRVDIFVGGSTGLYGAQGCDVVISMVDDAREPGVTFDLSWQSLNGVSGSGLIRRQLDDLIMSAGVNYRLFDEPRASWQSFRDLENGNSHLVEPTYPGWLRDSLTSSAFSQGGVGKPTQAYDFFYRVEVGDFALSWNNSNFSVPSARGLEPEAALYADDMEASSQESVYLTYVTDAGDGSWRFFWNMSYALSSISPETRFRSAMTQYEPAYVYRDEKTFVLEEYMLWELSSWASLFVGGGAGFGVMTPRSSLLEEPLDTARGLERTLSVEEVDYQTSTQISYRMLFGYGHLTFGNADGPRFQIGGRFDSDSRDALFLSPRLSLELPLGGDLAWRLSGELSKASVPSRLQFIGDSVVEEGTVVWERPGAPELERPLFYQVETGVSAETMTLRGYYRGDHVAPEITWNNSLDTPLLKPRKTVGLNLESSHKYRNLNVFLSYRGWASDIDDWAIGHRMIARSEWSLGSVKWSESFWIQHGDTFAENPWSGGLQLAMSRSLDELFPGFRIWGRAYAEQGKSRRSALEARQLPLPLARVGMRELGFLIGVEFIP